MPKTARPRTIGLITPYIGGVFSSQIIGGVYRRLRQHDVQLIVVQESPKTVSQLRLSHDLVDGWLVVSNTDGAEQIAAEGVPVVAISSIVPGLPAVLPDNHGGTRALVEHLLAHGHRQIAFIGPLKNPDVAQRFAGYQETLAAHGIPFNEQLVVSIENEMERHAAGAVRRLLAAGQVFSAVVAGTDFNALGVLATLQAAGLRVPEDVAVVGFDDIEPAQTTSPPLTTVRQSFEMLAMMAVDRLLAQIADPSRPADMIYTPTALVIRHSCGCEQDNAAPLVDVDAILHAPDWRAALAQQLVQIVAYPFIPSSEVAPFQLWPGLTTLIAAIDQTAESNGLPSKASIRLAWSEAIALSPQLDPLNTAASLLERVAVGRLGSAPPLARMRLSQALQRLRTELMRALVAHEKAHVKEADKLLYTHSGVNGHMLSAFGSSAPGLMWLSNLPAQWGCLGLWDDPTHTAELVLASLYVHDGETATAVGTRLAPAAFPPLAHETLDRSGHAERPVITLVRLRSEKRDWGMLAIAASLNSSAPWTSEPFVMWGRMLVSALEREALLQNLATQEQGLLQTYKREQLLIDTLRASEERYALAAAATNDGLWDWSIKTGEVYFSPRWKALLGYSETEVGTSISDWFERVHPDDLPSFHQAIRQHHAVRSSHFEVEQRIQHRDNEYRWMLCRGTTVYDETGIPLRLAGSISDISQRKQFEEQLRISALHDALTGLPNRTLLLSRLDQAIQRARRSSSEQFALLFLDLDRFKTINDSLGHLIGDRLLVGIAQRLQALVRATDIVARLGGDEFVILLNAIADHDDVLLIVQRIEEALREPFNLSGHEIFASASIGVSIGSQRYEQPEELLRDADTAMYHAKARGRGRHEVFSEPLRTEALARLQLETDLHRAIERQEFLLHYQPIASLKQGQIIGAEALVRWRHPTRGLVSPQEFIPLAEETGLIEPIGHWVLREACAQLGTWHRQGYSHLMIAVNVSVRQLKTLGFVEGVAAVLQETGLPARCLVIEMTESAYVEDAANTTRVIERLRAMGVQTAFDDFGTGYSSLSYLRHFQVNQIKVDRSFIRDVTRDPVVAAITDAIIAMAHRLAITVTAEGVETHEQLDLLRERECDTVQGHLISRAIPHDAFLALLRPSEPGHSGEGAHGDAG
ncbi:MAG TPA: EAL domain-containing protein [Roseiflexaceae bacterium]|nr:EAL domain-containing protein [Roseiflexaceae bacterium]